MKTIKTTQKVLKLALSFKIHDLKYITLNIINF